jgi:hypothetical protein
MGNFIKISSFFGIAIRKMVLIEKNIPREKVIEAFEMDLPDSENNELMTYGSNFGLDSAEILGKRLEKIGLEYIDDFFYFHGDFPDWAEFSVAIALKTPVKI